MQRKMKRKGLPPSEIFDARALRLVVDDADGEQLEAAIAACYKLMPAVHRLWRPIDGECDDYITQPKVGQRSDQLFGSPALCSESSNMTSQGVLFLGAQLGPVGCWVRASWQTANCTFAPITYGRII